MGKTKHNMSKQKIYRIWASMKARCLNPNVPAYQNYGGRGISVCSEWMTFENFYADMGDRPEGKSLDRINNDAGYNRQNCKWSNRKEQSRNRRGQRIISLSGRTDTIAGWCELTGIPIQTVWLRLEKGWAETDAVLILPIRSRAGIKRGELIRGCGVRFTIPQVAA